MASLGELFGSSGGGFSLGGVLSLLQALLYIAIGGGIIVAFWFFIIQRRKWNLKVLFNLPRGVEEVEEYGKGKFKVQGIVNRELGKGMYDRKRGCVWIKRKGVKKIALKPFKIDRYLFGNKNYLDVVQVGVEDYRPILPESYLNVTNEQGEESAILKMKVDTTHSKAWMNQFERSGKMTYAIADLLQKYATPISIGLVIILWGIQFIMVRKWLT